jgi:hypothetical protein
MIDVNDRAEMSAKLRRVEVSFIGLVAALIQMQCSLKEKQGIERLIADFDQIHKMAKAMNEAWQPLYEELGGDSDPLSFSLTVH